MNYKIITDEKLLNKFIDWLPELKPNETYYVSLIGRSKYCNDIKHMRSDKSQLKRVTSNKERLFDKIKQLECPLGSYKQRDIIIPQEAIAIYISLNPRNVEVATLNSAHKFIDLVSTKYTNYNPHQIVMSEIQKAQGTKTYIDIDFDLNDKSEITDALKSIEAFINIDCCDILETRGGIHCLINKSNIDKQYRNTWFNNFKTIPQIDFQIDKNDEILENMIPIVGCYQGGFTPKFI